MRRAPGRSRLSHLIVSATLAGAFAATLGGPASSAAAEDATSQPPVTADDQVSLYAGQMKAVKVLANDSDPDGDDLAVCRVTTPDDIGDVFVEPVGDRILVDATAAGLDPHTTVHDFTFTYYACDFQALVPATVTVTFREVQPLTVTKTHRAGRLRVTNDNDDQARFLYGDFHNQRPDGRVRIPAHESAVVKVARHRIDWVGVLHESIFAGTGHVRHIRLPDSPGVERATLLSRAEQRVWTTARG